MLEDLAEFRFAQVEAAIKAYRRDAKNRFFPTSGQLRDLAAIARREEHETAAANARGPMVLDSRPYYWWDMPKKHWKAHWREGDIPEPSLSLWLRKRQEASAAQ